jgi:hypothetical protein
MLHWLLPGVVMAVVSSMAWELAQASFPAAFLAALLCLIRGVVDVLESCARLVGFGW